MTARVGQTRRRILETAYKLFHRKGFSRVGVDRIAAQAGVTKRTLYNHFPSKDALLAEVLAFHSELALARIRRWGERLGGPADQMVDDLFGDLAHWAEQPRWEGAGYTRLVMELADLPGHPAHEVARRHKAAVEAWLAAQLREKKIANAHDRARELMLLLEGAMALMLIHRDSHYADTARQAARRLLQRGRVSDTNVPALH